MLIVWTFLREALTIYQKAFPKGHWETADCESLLGGCLSAQGRFGQAEPLLAGAYSVLKASKESPSERKRQALERLVELYDAWGKKDEADKWRKEQETVRNPPERQDRK